MIYRSALLLPFLFLAGCVVPEKLPVHKMRATFNIEEAKAHLVDGTNTIKGSALLRQRGGGVVTCAGQYVYLIPGTAYARERMRVTYGPREEGYVRFGEVSVVFEPEEYTYTTTSKRTRCDAQGFFTFEKVEDGLFFVATMIDWDVAGRQQGGHLTQRAPVANGQTLNLVLTESSQLSPL